MGVLLGAVMLLEVEGKNSSLFLTSNCVDSDTQRHHEVHPSFPSLSLVLELVAVKPGWIFRLFAGWC